MISMGGASRRAKVIGTAGIVGAVVTSGLVLAGADADAPPQRVLQSVNVDLGSDGTLFGIKGVDVRRVDGEKATSDSASYDPSRTADQLPVRVLTSYRTAERSGTDLADIKGYTGPVQIDITIQNTTVRPELLSYDAGGVSHQQYALVGVPLTVTASADLGKDNVAEVVTESDAGAVVTNGVLSQTRTGEAQVQWASLLAPPQLAPSVTFTLVENADKFELPQLDIGVQPGLATDSSIQGLVNAAFSESGSSQVRMEADTIRLIGQVTSVLADAGTQLNLVKRQLHFSADTLGARTIGDLTSSTQTVAGSTAQLSTQLDQLSSDLGLALNTTGGTAVSEMKASVDRVKGLLGDTSAPPRAPTVTGADCTATVTHPPRVKTVYGQLNEVITQLQGLAGATGRCSDAIKSSLLRSIGSSDTSDCAAHPTAICTISDSAGKLDGLITALAESNARAKGALDGTLVTTATDKLDALTAKVTALQAAAAALQGTGQGGHHQATDDSRVALRSLQADVDGIRQALADDQDSLTRDLGEVHDYALARVDEVGTDAGVGGSLSAETDTLAQEICSLKDAKGLTDADIEKLRSLTTGTDCAGATLSTAQQDPLATRLADQAGAWQHVADLTGGTSHLSGTVTALTDLDTRLGAVSTGIDTLLNQLGDHGLQGGISGLVDEINALYDANATGGASPLNALVKALGDVVGNQDAVKGGLDKDFQDFQDQVRAQRDAITSEIPVVDHQRQLSDGQIDKLFQTATGGLTDAGATIGKRGKAAIDDQNARMTAETSQFQTIMQRSVSGALHSIDTSVSSSTRDLSSAEGLLTKDLGNVLADLGRRDQPGTGLLGIIRAQAAQTQTSTARLGVANGRATEFGNVRGAELQGFYLQRAQLQRALDLEAQFPAFAIELPRGSQHVTVYSFHMRGVQ